MGGKKIWYIKDEFGLNDDEGYTEIKENYMTFYTILLLQMERTKLTSVILLNLYLASYMILNGERMI